MNDPKFNVGDILKCNGEEIEVIRIYNGVCWWESTNNPLDPWFMECRYLNRVKENLKSIQVSELGIKFDLISRPSFGRKYITQHSLY